jgi:hypothetical protein
MPAEYVVDTLGQFRICLPLRYGLKVISEGHIWTGWGPHEYPLMGVRIQIDSVPPTLQADIDRLNVPEGYRCTDCPRYERRMLREDTTGNHLILVETALAMGGFTHSQGHPVARVVRALSPNRWLVIDLLGYRASADLLDRIVTTLQWQS